MNAQEVTCPDCNLIQAYRNQKSCIHCGKRWSNWFLDRLAEALGKGTLLRPVSPPHRG
jgi:hypothetical protein